MQTIQLYIEGQRVDMFKDESVSLTQSIQNIRDIAKIFTDFSKTFTLPASKTNNKIFKHYYNFHIQNGFDARTKKNATIELNHLPFRDGKIKLEGVDLKNGVPYAYRITFFGSTVTLKDLLGEDKLNALNSLNTLNETYSPTEIESGLKRNPSTNDVVVPLITHTKRLFYDSTTGHSHDTQYTGNLYYDSGVGAGHEHGVAWSELKYALRVHKIVEAIQSRYGITFSDDFFADTNERYYNLFMWLHRKKGDVISGTQIESYSKLVDGWTTSYDDILDMINPSTAYIQSFVPVENIRNFELTLIRVTSEPYDIQIFRNGIEVYSESSITATTRVIDVSPYAQANSYYTVVLNYSTSITFANITWFLRYVEPIGDVITVEYSTGSFSVATVFEFIITEQIPDIKVIDFLTGLFKMFNLTAYVEKNTGIIKVLPLNEFYANYNSYDISKYIVSDSSSVNVSLPYREISFSYEDTNTFLAKTHDQLFGLEWAKTEYTQVPDDGSQIDGELYDVKLPFSHLKYERLYDLNDSTLTTIQWGWFADDNQDAYIGKPLLFYPVLNAIQDNGVAEGISFVDAVDSDGTYTSHKEITESIVMPSNAVSFANDVNTANINFKAEQNEYRFNTYTNTLFKEYYQNYIISVFNEKNRLTKVTAYLPLRILLNYTLADRFIINGNSYKINSINTNLETGKSELELLNDL